MPPRTPQEQKAAVEAIRREHPNRKRIGDSTAPTPTRRGVSVGAALGAVFLLSVLCTVLAIAAYMNL